jgi:hypothetical protein
VEPGAKGTTMNNFYVDLAADIRLRRAIHEAATAGFISPNPQQFNTNLSGGFANAVYASTFDYTQV